MSKSIAENESAYIGDPFYREVDHEIRVRFPQNHRLIAKQLCFVLIKPDGMINHCMDKVLSYLVNKSFTPIYTKLISLNRYSVRELWKYELPIATYERLMVIDKLLSMEKSLLICFRKTQFRLNSASEEITKIKGHSDEKQRKKHHLRSYIGAGSHLLNFIHTPDGTFECLRELGVLLNKRCQKDLFNNLAHEKDITCEVSDLIAHITPDIHFTECKSSKILEKLQCLTNRLPHSDLKVNLQSIFKTSTKIDYTKINRIIQMCQFSGMPLSHQEQIILQADYVKCNIDSDTLFDVTNKGGSCYACNRKR